MKQTILAIAFGLLFLSVSCEEAKKRVEEEDQKHTALVNSLPSKWRFAYDSTKGMAYTNQRVEFLFNYVVNNADQLRQYKLTPTQAALFREHLAYDNEKASVGNMLAPFIAESDPTTQPR